MSETVGGAELRSCPWHPHRPVWERLPPKAAASALDWWEERAAIIQHEGGESQGGAEEIAYMLLCGLLERLGLLEGDPARDRQLDLLKRQERHWQVVRIERALADPSSLAADRIALAGALG